MTQTQYFSSGLELANFVVIPDILQQAWTAISELYKETSQKEPSSSVKFKIYEPLNCTIIAFFTWPANSKDCVQGNEGGDFVTSSALKGYFPHFNFLCPKGNQKFSINKPALELFTSIFDVLPKSVMTNSKPLIITGNSLGGSVASLFTLSLLEKINFTNTKRPLCITFGSPLIGDEDLQEAISKYAAWNSCFLHVVSDQDPVPRVLISQTGVYKPFGTFLLCSKVGCSCFEDPRTILELLKATYSGSPGNQDPNLVFDVYGTFVKDINRKVICKDTTMLPERTTQPLRACITTQIVATGLMQPEQQQQQQQQNVDVNIIITEIAKREKMTAMLNREAFDPTKGLNDIKVYMAYLEQYKKLSKDDGIGYYDKYKFERLTTTYMDLEKYKKSLTIYWKDMVDQAEKRPQTIGAFLRTRMLFGGTNYRRMIEPLDIADYYNKGLSDYINNGRSEHYKKLEQWLKETEKPSSSSGPNDLKKQNVKSILTEDSCFWAQVEEALILCELLTGRESSVMNKESSKKKRKASAMDEESSKKKLVEFENYIYGLLKNYAVSSEIFLPKSSFMKWWGEYREIMGTSYSSSLTNFLKNDNNYEAYAKGSLVF
ncbi:senescence-associated carboxylesterase 101-like isoform X2 [Quercus robur]|uniref:senescence-associated carboxylesterase 101-like isoform X2 n=1 Tax=Quercus robur TaxID=38942 RepID=UPI00216349C1|nr:senescence-associated carboxylesterase 101-like isoform X2 [Quercus robur]